MEKSNKPSSMLSRLKILNEIYAYPIKTKKEFLDYVLTKALKLTESKFGYIYYYSEEKKQFILNTWSKDAMPNCSIQNPETCYELDKTGYWGEAVRQRKAIINNNFHVKNKHHKGYPEGHVEISKFLSIPIFIKGKIVAVVGVANKPINYTLKDASELELLMNAVWSMLENYDISVKHKQIAQAVYNAKASIVITNIDGGIEYVNPYFTEITGYSYEEALGKNPRILKSGFQSPEFYIHMWNSLTSGKTWRGELKNKTKSGDFYWEDAIISPIKNNKGKISHYVAVKHNITEQKKFLDRLLLQEQMQLQAEEVAKIGSWEYDVETENISWSKGLYKLHGLSPKTPMNELIQESLKCYQPADNQIIHAAFLKCIQEGVDYDFTVPFTNRKGKKLWIRTKTKALKANNKVSKVFGVLLDITQEEKQKQEISKAKKQFEIVYKNAKIAIALNDAKGNFIMCNQAMLDIFGYSEEEIKQKSPLELTHPSFVKIEKNYFKEIFAGKRDFYKIEKIIICKSGEFKWVDLSVNVTRNPNGELSQMVGSLTDITATKNAEIALIESESKFKGVVNAFNDIIYTLDTKQVHTGVFGKWTETENLGAFSFLGKTAADIFGKEQAKVHIEANKKALKGVQVSYQWQIKTNDNKITYYQTNLSPLRNTDGKITGLLGVGRDITELKLKEEQLYYAIKGTRAGTWDWYIKTGETYFNETYADLLGYTLDELSPVSISTWEKFTHPDDLKIAYQEINKHIEGKTEIYDVKFRMKHKKGHWVWIWDRGEVVERNASGEAIRMVGTHMDVTEWMNAEKRLMASEEQYRFLTESINTWVWSALPNGMVNYINEYGKRFLGKHAKNIYQNGWISLLHPEDQKRAEETWIKAQKTLTTYKIQFRIKNGKNEFKWLDVSANPQLDENKKVKLWIGNATDINNDKLQKEELLNNQNDFKLLSQLSTTLLKSNTPDEIYKTIAKGVYTLLKGNTIVAVTEYSQNFTQWTIKSVYGLNEFKHFLSPKLQQFKLEGATGRVNPLRPDRTFSPELQNLGSDLSDITENYFPAQFTEVVKNALPPFNVYTISFINNNVTKGNVFFFHFINQPMPNEVILKTFLSSSAVALENTINKINLEQSNLRFELASAATKDVVWDWSLGDDSLIWGNSVFNVFGNLKLKNHISDWYDNLHPDDYNSVSKKMKEFLKNKNISEYHLEYRFKKADYSFAYVYESGTILRLPSGKPYRVIGALRDMTETKNYTEAIKRQNSRLKTINWIQSHELRAPLSRILGIAELLKEKDLEKDLLDELIVNIVKSSAELDDVVKSIVDNAKTEKNTP